MLKYAVIISYAVLCGVWAWWQARKYSDSDGSLEDWLDHQDW